MLKRGEDEKDVLGGRGGFGGGVGAGGEGGRLRGGRIGVD